VSLWAGSGFRNSGFNTAELDVRKEETLASVRYRPFPLTGPKAHYT